MPPLGNEDLGYKFEVDGESVELLGTEGVRHDPKTIGKHRNSRSRVAARR